MTSTVRPSRHSDELDAQLCEWLTTAQQHPRGSLIRQQHLTRVISLIQSSGKLWRGGGVDPDDYNEALQQTWLYLCRKLETYDPSQAGVITWLNHYLKYRLMDLRLARQAQQTRTLYGQLAETGEWLDPLDQVPSPPSTPFLLEAIQAWLQQESATLRRKHVYNRPAINCYRLIQERLPPETPWEVLSQTLGVPVSTLSNFYQRECLPRLRAFAESHWDPPGD